MKDIPALMENTSMDSATTSSSTPTAVKSGAWGTGGIQTKVTAALMASHAGVTTAIVSSNHFNHILQMIDGGMFLFLFLFIRQLVPNLI